MDDSRKITIGKANFLLFLDKNILTYDEIKQLIGTNVFEGKESGSAVLFCAEQMEAFATIWIGVNNVSMMINKEEIKSFKFLL